MWDSTWKALSQQSSNPRVAPTSPTEPLLNRYGCPWRVWSRLCSPFPGPQDTFPAGPRHPQKHPTVPSHRPEDHHLPAQSGSQFVLIKLCRDHAALRRASLGHTEPRPHTAIARRTPQCHRLVLGHTCTAKLYLGFPHPGSDHPEQRHRRGTPVPHGTLPEDTWQPVPKALPHKSLVGVNELQHTQGTRSPQPP